MKKETVNVFDGGLNKDLNPLVTPNNVLTDNVNGTFLTFNGDELSLQNDAGNTRIPVPETGDSVKLSEGFYPIGIKEYGGVLYIVSGKKGVDEFNRPDPQFDEIEFGSYPSPELASYTTFHGQKTIPLDNSADKLYKSYVINNDYFKTGRYITFKATPDFDLSNVWTPENYKGLYEIKLLLQLDNGVIDLTNNVWDMYLEHKKNNPEDLSTHWLISNSFIYHCPYSYKGRLAVKTVMSEPTFKPIKYYDIVPESNGYNFKLDIKVENTPALQITKAKINIITDKVPTESFEVNVVNGIIQIEKLIPSENKIMHYEIIPEFKAINTSTILDWNKLPSEFKDKYEIKGYILLEERFFNLGFNLLEGACFSDKGEKHYKVLGLIDPTGYVNPLLEPLSNKEKPYVFVEYGSDTEEMRNKYNILGTYRVNQNTYIISSVSPYDTKITIGDKEFNSTIEAFNEADSSLWGVIETKLKQIQTIILDSSCSEVTITIEFSAPLDMEGQSIVDGSLILYQDGSSSLIPYESWDGRTFTATVNAAQPLSIQFSHQAFSSVRKTILSPDSETTYKIGLILNLHSKYAVQLPLALGYQVIFYNNRIPLHMDELCEYITSRFDTNIPNRMEIQKVETQYDFNFIDNRLSHNKGTQYNNISAQIVDKDYNPDRIFHYLYRVINGQDVAKNEYINIDTIDSTNDTGYIKLGSNDLGYLLFKKEGSLISHNIKIDLSQTPLWA